MSGTEIWLSAPVDSLVSDKAIDYRPPVGVKRLPQEEMIDTMLRGYRDIARVGLVGGGVIGTGWAVRCLANGLDVSMTDPAPEAEARFRETIARTWPTMEQIGLAEGASVDRFSFHPTIEAAVDEADFVHENVPEREDVKTSVIAEISKHLSAEVIISSSSSGLLPTSIQSEALAPERVIIGHPFSPLYILPLVELVGGEQTSAEAIAKAAGYFTRIGMRPLHVRNEIEAYIGDRLQEALWHEALHLVNDGIATMQEIDAAITGGPGLRWAFMGIGMGWHVAAGEGGMRVNMQHFAPTLELPWTKLEAPAFTERLNDLVVEGCEAQQGDRHWLEMEQRRDQALIKIREVIQEYWYPEDQDGWPKVRELP